MKIIKIILIVILFLVLIFGGYKAWGLFKKWEANKYSEITMLKFNQNMFLQKITDLSTTLTKVVNDTAKVTTNPKPDNTYESLKAQVIELKKDETANKDEIKILKEKLSEQRQAFLKSSDTILVSGKNDETYLLYRDESGNLQPASDNIEKIIEHTDVSNIPIPIKEVELVKKSYMLKAGAYYSFDRTYGLILSKDIINIKDYSFNVSLLSDLKSIEGIKLGANINYNISNSLELGVGITMDKTYFMCLEYSF